MPRPSFKFLYQNTAEFLARREQEELMLAAQHQLREEDNASAVRHSRALFLDEFENLVDSFSFPPKP
jgi:hypothetical protein